MKHSIKEIEKMLEKITCWPVMEVGANTRIDCHKIISDLLNELNEAKGLMLSLVESMEYLMDNGESELFEEDQKLLEKARQALERWK